MSEYRWLNKHSQKFLEDGYLLEGQTVDDRVKIIAENAERILGIEGYGEKFKENFKKGWYSLSTPVWSNFGTDRALPISCFGSTPSDSMDSILYTASEVGMMTKLGGGTSAYFGDLRCRGSEIKNNGKSSGAVHFMQLFDKMMQVISQGKVRRGSFAGYLPVDHGDIEEFLKIKSEGDPIQDISFGVCIPDQFMKDMIAGDKHKRKIWAKILQSRANVGYPYLFFTDNVNNNKPDVYKDRNLLITHSNLCSEIMLPDNEQESFVCDLSSMNLLYYDEWKDTDAVEVLIFLLDAVMTEFIEKAKNIKFMERTVKFAENHRALGLGVLGYHSYLQSKMIAFESMEAKFFNTEVFQLLKKQTYDASAKLAEMFGEPELLKGYGRRNTTTCVTGDTKILTDRGFVEIETILGEKTNIWNGFEFSEVVPFETGENEILEITLSNGFSLKCTPYHKFLVVTPIKDDKTFGLKKTVEVEAQSLRVGDCMPKFLLPIIDNELELDDAYTNGFFTGDGSVSCVRNGKYPRNELRLYGNKMDLADKIKWKTNYRKIILNGSECVRGYLPNSLREKYFVPVQYSLKSKLEWLAGIIDSDGSITSRGVSICTSKYSFAKDIMFMLQTIGIHPNLVLGKRLGGYNSTNDIYYNVFITQQGCTILSEQGIKTYRVKIPKGVKNHLDCPNNNYYQVVEIKKMENRCKTFCFTENKRGTGIFNGIYTKQCAIAPTKSSAFILGQVSEGIEPIKSNYFVKDLAKGKFTYKNPYLKQLLKDKGEDSGDVWDTILRKGGSVQHLRCLTDEEKDVFKTFQEISPKEVIIQASQRQKYIDQGQSLNLMIHPKVPIKDVNALMIFAWEMGIKALYYQFSVNASQEFAKNILECKSCE